MPSKIQGEKFHNLNTLSNKEIENSLNNTYKLIKDKRLNLNGYI